MKIAVRFDIEFTDDTDETVQQARSEIHALLNEAGDRLADAIAGEWRRPRPDPYQTSEEG